MTGLFHCSWGCARDYIQGNKSGTILGFANEGKVAVAPIQVETKAVEPTIDPMETLIQGKLILIEVALAVEGLKTRCRNLAQGYEQAIAVLKDVHAMSDLLDTNEDLTMKLSNAEHGLELAEQEIVELKAKLGRNY